ncbi:YteA family regulatory protein [Bacillus ectoiniformans]|uniref:TraR/DksA C4-type zinc finger protein n=1 Tax=Bacillus ectoiniformans TaxID=1494429 RepID=UPI00195602DE|nr:TraR/DksA C4-type zinc finger protein [Bacillus ectoiniformans]MBM7649732.1 YteA family regulatory protein [Bacillus ectoiniformans]
MLTTEQLASLKKQLLDHKEQILNKNGEVGEDMNKVSERDATGELSLVDNHPADAGTELYEREKDLALEAHDKQELKKIDLALQAMEDGSYGVCKASGEEIPYERLEAVPTALYSVDHSPDQDLHENRPVEEDILQPGDHDRFRHKDREVKDYEDSFQEVASFGTSETPSDFEGDHENFSDLYEEPEEEGFTEEYESFTATDINGENKGFYRSEKEREYTEDLEDEGMETPLGDLPYKKSDGYVEDK